MPPKEGRTTPLLLLATADAERRRGIRAVLSRAGYAVEETADARASVEAFRGLRPDLVLVDAGSPDGLATCRELRREEERPGATPILLLVEPGHLGSIAEAREAGASDFVEVTLHEALIEHRVRAALELCERLVLEATELEDPFQPAEPESRPVRRFARDEGEMARELGLAIDRSQLALHYQPKLDVRTQRIVGMEALLRWTHPELGGVPPSEFIPVAEATGLIVPIGEWALRTACRQTKAWQQRGLHPVRMAVNLSQLQFRRNDLCDVVGRALEETGLAAEWLELELTESMLMRDVHATVRSLERLKAAGIHLSIDDFGTGYSSLSYLRRFPIDALKIDQSFVRDVIADPDDAAIVTSIILMGHSLKLTVIAEGVETESQLSFLRVLQCDEIQGYLVSPPVPAEQAESFLANGRR